jgi:ankyrin repeat protein
MTGPEVLHDDPLAMTLDRQDEDILRLLLKHGVQNSFALALRGVSVLHQAALLDRPKTLQVLLEGGVDPDQQCLGRTALHLAVQVKSLEMARILVEHGASSQLVDNQNETPHHVTARNRQILILQLLLANDPDPVVREYFLKTPIDEFDSPEAEAVLLTKGGAMGSLLTLILQIDPSLKRRRGPPLSVVYPKESRKKSSHLWCWT